MADLCVSSYLDHSPEERAFVADCIAKHGHAVFGGCECLREDGVIVSYTCGRAQAKKPELFLTMFGGQSATILLNKAATLLDQMTIQDTVFVENLSSGYTACFRRVPAREASQRVLHKTRDYFGHDLDDVMQLIFPDKHHRWPWEKGCAPGLVAGQSILVDWSVLPPGA